MGSTNASTINVISFGVRFVLQASTIAISLDSWPGGLISVNLGRLFVDVRKLPVEESLFVDVGRLPVDR